VRRRDRASSGDETLVQRVRDGSSRELERVDVDKPLS